MAIPDQRVADLMDMSLQQKDSSPDRPDMAMPDLVDLSEFADLVDAPADMLDLSTLRVDTCVALTPIGANLDYATPWQAAMDAGVREPGDININWSALETAPGQFTDPDGGVLAMWNMTLSGARVALTLATMQTSEETVPADLDTGVGTAQFARYAEPATAMRYLAALDDMLARLSNLEPWVLAVGNEIDIAIATAQNPQLEDQVWRDYLTFLERVREGVHTRDPEMLVGVKLGWEAVLAGDQRVLDLIAASDVLIVSYYPSRGNFQVKAISEIEADVLAMLARAEGKPVYIAEAGYPSGEANGSSSLMQAEFVSEMLRLHQAHAQQVRATCFVWMHDLADEILDAEIERLRAVNEDLARNEAFISFLGTLGLRTEQGEDKLAFDVLRQWSVGQTP